LAREMLRLAICAPANQPSFGSWHHPDSDAERVLNPERYTAVI